MNRTYDPRKVKRHRSYTVESLAQCLDVQPNTVRQWIKHHGLPTLPDTYPVLMHWTDIRKWITIRQESRRWKLAPDEMSCFSCNASRKIKIGTFWIEPSDTMKIIVHGDCVECGKTLNRFDVKGNEAGLEAKFTFRPDIY